MQCMAIEIFIVKIEIYIELIVSINRLNALGYTPNKLKDYQYLPTYLTDICRHVLGN